MRIGVIGIRGSWSSEALADAVAERCGERHLFDVGELELDVSSGRVFAAGTDLSTFTGLVVKKIASSYSPQALDRLEILHLLEARGVRVFSPTTAMRPLINRLMGTVRLRIGDVPMPRTHVTENIDEAVRVVEAWGSAIAKPLYTSKGRGMDLIEAGSEVRSRLARFRDAGNPIMYLQEKVDLPGRDLGVAFLGGRYLATYARVQARSGSWSTTTADGGHYEAHVPSDEILEVAARAQRLFGLDFTCVDVVETARGPLVFEVSAFGGFRGLREGCRIDAAARYAQHVWETCHEARS